MQHFRLQLECDHTFDVTAVDELHVLKEEDGKTVPATEPHKPDYVGKEFPCHECNTIEKAVSQKRIAHLGA